MPGVSGSGLTPPLAANDCGVSRKLNHSNSMPHIGAKPAFAARASTRFSSWRGQIGDGAVPSGSDEVAEEERHVVVPGHARGRSPRSRRASASG